MKKELLLLTMFVLAGSFCESQEKSQTTLAGVYQGKSLFIQNPYNSERSVFCVERIEINEQPVPLNYNLSALKLDFEGWNLFTPIQVKIVHRDTICEPVIINPEAVLFHSIFRFAEVVLTDSLILWQTKGERGKGKFVVEKLKNGIWRDFKEVEAEGDYTGASYQFYPALEEGPNKMRVKYIYPAQSRRKYLYSREVEFDYYPDPVEFQPKMAKTRLFLSRAASYEIYNTKRERVLVGEGKEVDIRPLRKGEYVIYFDGGDPGSFEKE
ncbi:MAG: hypothetical protein AAF789_06290 [Bacteroidota bacterium]